MSAAAQARRRTSRDVLDVVVVERGRFTSYSACGIPYWIGGGVEGWEQLISRTPDQHRANGVDVRTRTEAVAVDLDARSLTVADIERGVEEVLGFDQLLLATGSVPNRPDIPGITAANVHGVQVLDDGSRCGRS
jgi:NADPH-dependent 2,4-dienoyl-CoA reductase/sulfur reductase-like enzyme